ncbi:CpaD family pilus assembly lipoprotein [Ferrimonas aestuarii]|uniref:Pilus assembly protein CpaD n=1 Tax=Ferrimonas aestuarii TaxID=2569539 RepID=A0A4V5NWK7_9GAMM|nr:CpaD family pilus assembly lipoprotein [Ferrimonas aestuarii]TKB58478.1 hypothetical protein FCL42_01660 [Ferrimonas aestuarii]
MIRSSLRFIALLSTLLLTACADHAFDPPGAETLIYQQTQDFEFGNNGASDETLARLLTHFSSQATLTLRHGPQQTPWAKALEHQLLALEVDPARIVFEQSQTQGLRVLSISQWHAKSQPCGNWRYDRAVTSLGCSTNANLAAQLVNPEKQLTKSSLQAKEQ